MSITYRVPAGSLSLCFTFIALLLVVLPVARAATQCSGQCSGYYCPSDDNCVINYNGFGESECACQSNDNAGVIAGSVIGAVIFVCIILCIIGLCFRQRSYNRGTIIEMQSGPRVYSANGTVIGTHTVYSPAGYVPTGIPVGQPVAVMGSPVYGQPQYAQPPMYATQPQYSHPPPSNPGYTYAAAPPSSPPAYTGQAFKMDPEFPEVDKTRSGEAGGTYTNPPRDD